MRRRLHCIVLMVTSATALGPSQLATAQSWTEQDPILTGSGDGDCDAVCDATDTDGNGDYFGFSVAIDANYLVIGAPRAKRDGKNKAGLVYVFKKEGGCWVEKWCSLAPTPGAGNQFGDSVDISGSRLIVGEPGNDAAHTYERDGEDWCLDQTLTSPDMPINFGKSVAISGTWAVVGDPEITKEGKAKAGAAYFFKRVGAADWDHKKTRTAALVAEIDGYFGWRVAIAGDDAVVGMPGPPGGSPGHPGSAFVFGKNEGGTGNWGEDAAFTDLSTTNGERVGFSVAIDGDVLAIGARDRKVRGDAGAGSVFISRRVNGAWGRSVEKTDPCAAAQDHFGTSVSVSEDTVVVGSPRSEECCNKEGSAHVFSYDGDWDQHAPLSASDADAEDEFGVAVAIDGATILCGADEYEASSPPGSCPVRRCDTGSVYVFEDASLALDLDADGQITAQDLTPLIELWGSPASTVDMDGDGVVGLAELLELIQVLASYGARSYEY